MTQKQITSAHLNNIVILPSSEEYAEQMEAMTGIVYDNIPREDEYTFDADLYRQHMKVFPEGQFIALDTATNRVVGLTSGMRTLHDPAHRHTDSWWETVGHGTLSTHVPNGDWMYGVESCVHPDYRGYGVGSKLMDARFNVLKRLNLRGMIAGSAIIDYHKVVDTVPVEQYVEDVIAGRRFDTNLTKQLHKGFTVQYIIPGYLFHDSDCAGYGVLIQWDNPDYAPAEAPQHKRVIPPHVNPPGIPLFG